MNIATLGTPSRDSQTFTPAKSVPLTPSAPDAAQNGQPFSIAGPVAVVPAGQPPAGGTTLEMAVNAGTVPPAGVGSDMYGSAQSQPQNIRSAVGFAPDDAAKLEPVNRTPFNRPAWYMYTSQVDPNIGNALNPPITGQHGEIEQGVASPIGMQTAWPERLNSFRLSPQPYDTFLPLQGTPPGA